MSYTPLTEMPLQVMETTGLKHGGPVGEKLVDPRFIFIEDRAYFKIKRIEVFVSDVEKQWFVIRMKENVEIVQPHALKHYKSEGSPVTRDVTCQLGTTQSRSENRHRVVFFKDDDGNEMRVVTNVMDVSPEEIANMYQARCGIELFFRGVKQNFRVMIRFYYLC